MSTRSIPGVENITNVQANELLLELGLDHFLSNPDRCSLDDAVYGAANEYGWNNGKNLHQIYQFHHSVFFLLVPMYFTIYKTFIISHCQYFHKFTNDFVYKKSNKIFLRNPINMHQILNEHCLFYLHKWILCSSKMFILKVSEKNPINFFPCRVYQFS